MLLNELIKTSIKNRSINDHDYNALKDERAQNLIDKKENSGAYGKVIHDKTDPHMVKKSNYLPVVNLEKNDGYFSYIKKIVDDDLASSNPYFPRVYDIKTFTDSFGEQRYRIQLEKLISLDDIDEKDLYHLMARSFPNFKINFKENKYNLNDTIDDYLNNRHKFNTESVDPHLISALEVINKVIKSNPNFSDDLTKDNMMARRTSFGYQLVFVDPISG